MVARTSTSHSTSTTIVAKGVILEVGQSHALTQHAQLWTFCQTNDLTTILRDSINIRNHMLFKEFPRLKSKNQLINTITIQITVSIDRWGRTCLRISIGNNERIKRGIRLVVGHSRLVLTNDAIISRGIYLFLLTRAFTTTWLWLFYWWRWSRRSQAILLVWTSG